MEDLNLLLFNKLRECDRFMRMQENLCRNLTDDEAKINEVKKCSIFLW